MNSQHRMFGRTNPLEERLGYAFFEDLPQKPGVYKMISGNGQILYVGKAKNLTADHYEMECTDQWAGDELTMRGEQVYNFLMGRDMELVRELEKYARDNRLLDDFLGKVVLQDLDLMKRFYEKCTRRNYLMYKVLDLESHCIPQKSTG